MKPEILVMLQFLRMIGFVLLVLYAAALLWFLGAITWHLIRPEESEEHMSIISCPINSNQQKETKKQLIKMINDCELRKVEINIEAIQNNIKTGLVSVYTGKRTIFLELFNRAKVSVGKKDKK